MSKNRKAKEGGKIKYLTIFRNWMHQSFSYLDRTEMFYRFFWEIIPSLIIAFYINSSSYLISFVLSIFLVHTYNWIFNNNFWAVIIHSMPSQKNPGETKTIKYLVKMQKRLLKSSSISGVLIYGSMTKNKWHSRSDIDIRFFRKKGWVNGLKSYILLRRERFIAFFSKQPLDSYIADNIKFLNKMNKNEKPIFIKNTDKRLYKRFKRSEITDFNKIKSLKNLIDEDN